MQHKDARKIQEIKNIIQTQKGHIKKNGSPWWWVPTLYFAEGVPYFLVTSVSITLFTQLGMPNGQMALFTSLITFPWVIKPMWSPFVDVIRTKRWWILLMQVLMCVAVLLLAWFAPQGYFTLALIFFTITAFASATHDIAADGFYMLALSDKQQSAFVGIRSTFYKIANIFCQSLLLMLVGWLQTKTTVALSWTYTLLGCSGLLAGITLWHTFFLPKAEKTKCDAQGLSTTYPPDIHLTSGKGIWHEVGETFVEFFRKPGIWLALCFMLLYRLPEALLLKLCNPFFLAPQADGGLGLSVDTVGQIYGIGVVLMLLGGIIGGLWASRVGLRKAMLPMAFCLTLPSAVYIYLAAAQPESFWIVSACIGVEQLGYGLGYTACMLYMMHFAEGVHRTAHFSLCTAVMFLGLMLPGMVAGYIEEPLGYLNFFWVVMLCCIPSIIVAYVVCKKL